MYLGLHLLIMAVIRAMYSLTGQCRKHDLLCNLQLDIFNTIVMTVMTNACEILDTIIDRELNFCFFFKACIVYP